MICNCYCKDTFPTSEGSLAPGISCTYLVSFSPDSIATFDDHVKVSMCTVMLSTVVLGYFTLRWSAMKVSALLFPY